MKLSFLILFFILQVRPLWAGQLMADASLWIQNKFSKKSCEDVSLADLSNFKSKFAGCSAANNILLSSKGTANEIAESMLFNSLANKQLEQTACKISNVDLFKQNPKLIKLQAEQIEQKLPFIKEQITAANLAYAEFSHASTQASIASGYLRNAQGTYRQDAIKFLEEKKLNAEKLEKIWKAHRAAVHTAIGSFWNGNTESIEKMIFKFSKADPAPTKSEIETTLFNTIDSVKQEYLDNQKDLLNQSNVTSGVRIFDDLNDSTKAQLLEGITTSEAFTGAVQDKDESMLRLMCRAEGRYTKGREKLNTALTVGSFALGGAAGLLSKIPLAVRAGTLGNVLLKARSSSVILGAIAGGIDISMVADSISKACFESKASFHIQNACASNKEAYEKEEIERLSQDNCMFEAVVNALPAGVVASSIAYKVLSPKIQAAIQTVKEERIAKRAANVAEFEEDLRTQKKTGKKEVSLEQPVSTAESKTLSRRVGDGLNTLADDLERRSFQSRTLKGPEGQILRVHMAPTIPNIPQDTRILKVRNPEGKEVLYYEFSEKLASGEWVKRTREIQLDNVDSLSKLGKGKVPMPERIQALDARFVGGRELFDHIVQSKAGKAHVAFIDVGSLGKVNKDFASGTVGGDRYLRSVRETIMKNSEGKITLARLGGDEFGLIIDEVDSDKVQQMLAKIQKEIRSDFSSDAKAVFHEEKARLAQEYKDAKAKAKANGEEFDHDKAFEKIYDIARTASPDISIGSAQIGLVDPVDKLMEAAERQARDMKIKTVLEHGRNAEKYRNYEEPNAIPKPLYVAPVAEPEISMSWNLQPEKLNRPRPTSMRSLKAHRKSEVVSIKSSNAAGASELDTTTIALYEDEAKRRMYRVEKYMTDPLTKKVTLASYEIPTRGQTGLWDGMHEVSQSLVMTHVNQSPENLLVMPKLTSLRYLNYFASGTKAGDEMLQEVSNIIKKSIRLPNAKKQTSGDLAFKLNGADFLVSFEKMSPSEITKLEKRMNEELARSEVFAKMKLREEAELKIRLAEAKKNGNLKEIEAYQKNLDELPNFVPNVSLESMRPSDIKGANFDQILEKFDKKFEARKKAQ